MDGPVPHPHLVDKNSGGISQEQGVPAPYQAAQPRVPGAGREVPITSSCRASSYWIHGRHCWSPKRCLLKKLTHGLIQTHLFDTRTLGGGLGLGLGPLTPKIPLPNFYPWVWDQPLPCLIISAPRTSLDGCGFFNFIVVGLPFSLISDGSEWWLFYSLVVILMWLCEEVSHVCLCCHLDWKPEFLFLRFK